MKSTTRIVSLCFAVILCLFTIAGPAFAAEAVGGGIATTGSGNSTFTDSGKASGYYGNIPTSDEILGQTGDVVTIEDATNWVDRKGGEVVSFAVHTVKPICVVGIFLCVIMCIAGAVGNKKLLVGGLIGILICAVLFTLVTCWPEVLNAFSSWLMS